MAAVVAVEHERAWIAVDLGWSYRRAGDSAAELDRTWGAIAVGALLRL